MKSLSLNNLIQFLLLIPLQVFIMRHLSIYDWAFCYIYIGFLLFLPLNTPVVLQLVTGFLTGFIVDIFYDTLGIHAAACVLLMFLRPFVIRVLTPRDGYDASDSANVHKMGWPWFLVFSLFLIFMHHAALFILEVGGFRMFWFTLIKIFLSTIFTFLVAVIIQFLFFPVKGSR
jgi:hypothetical protein